MSENSVVHIVFFYLAICHLSLSISDTFSFPTSNSHQKESFLLLLFYHLENESWPFFFFDTLYFFQRLMAGDEAANKAILNEITVLVSFSIFL